MALSADDNENQAYNMETVDITGLQVTTIRLWVYGKISVVDVQQPYGDVNVVGLNEKVLNMPYADGWRSVVWSGLTITTQATIDNLVASINSKGCNALGPNIIIWGMYLEITTESLAVGPANLSKWNGIDTSNMVKWNGINWEDLVKYNGID